MNRILLFLDRENCPWDFIVDRPINYGEFESGYTNLGNVGNKLFVSAIQQYLTREDIVFDIYDKVRLSNYANDKYNAAIMVTANLFGVHAIRALEYYSNLFQQIKVPVYVIGCGIQCGSYQDMDFLIKNTQAYVRRFCEAVYCSGGELALRGYFTKEYLDKIMPNTAQVLGCPSMYMKGRGLHISEKTVNRWEDFSNLRIAVNGHYGMHSIIEKILDQFPKAVFMDQGQFARLLYGSDIETECKNGLCLKYSYNTLKYITEGRIKVLYDVPVWLNYLKKFDVAIGSRIHGNLAAILAGVPAFVIWHDARTHELADFFNIPCANIEEGLNVQEIIRRIDYTQFNKTFAAKFDLFQTFLQKHILGTAGENPYWEHQIKTYVWKMADGNKKNLKAIKKYMRGVVTKIRAIFAEDNQVIIFGAGHDGKLLMSSLRELGYYNKVWHIYDKNFRGGRTIFEKEVENPDLEIMKKADYIIIATTKYEDVLYDEYAGLGIAKEKMIKISSLM